MTKSNKELLGDLGEKIIANRAVKKKYKVEMAADPYDSKKDLTINGQSTEVKTQVPWVTRNCFTINSEQTNQWKKCQEVVKNGILIFVSVPCARRNTSFIYQIKKGFDSHLHKTTDGREMYCIPINDKNCKILGEINGKDKELLRRYGTEFK
tara:strand:+ start:72 stop:527 length:456 start_codon:yes stop_codon:yes gene_type:complete